MVYLVINLASGPASSLISDTRSINLLAKKVAASVRFMWLLSQQRHLLSVMPVLRNKQTVTTIMMSPEWELVHGTGLQQYDIFTV